MISEAEVDTVAVDQRISSNVCKPKEKHKLLMHLPY